MKALGSGGMDVFLFLLTTSVALLSYWLVVDSPALRRRFEARFSSEYGSLLFFVFNKFWGTFWFGFVCLGAARLLFPDFSLHDLGLRLPDGDSGIVPSLLWGAGLSALLVGSNWARSGRIARSSGDFSGDFGRYPEIRSREWSAATVALTVGLWCLYLLAYEALFRGALLFTLRARLGLWPAVGINVALYSTVHISKGAAEAVGALALGFALCLITVETDSIAVAFVVHAALAISNDLFAFLRRPDMRFRRPAASSERGS